MRLALKSLIRSLQPFLISIFLGLTLSVGFAAFGQTEPTYACFVDANGTQGDGSASFFGIKSWHHYLPCDTDGSIDNSQITLNSLWLIGLAIFETLLFLGGFLAFIFVIWGGVKYMTSQGNPEATTQARKTIINSLAGLIITISSSVLVTFLINLLTNGTGVIGGTGGLNIPDNAADASVLDNLLSFVFAILGVLAVIYVVIGAIKFATSVGEPQKTTQARNTIIYALVGLVIVLAAEFITSAILDRVDNRGAIDANTQLVEGAADAPRWLA